VIEGGPDDHHVRARVRREVGARERDVVKIVDFLKPGVAELAGLLPGAPARWLLAWDRRRQARGKAPAALTKPWALSCAGMLERN